MSGRCLFPWTQVYVENDAVVKPCCSAIELGNLRDTALDQVQFSKAAGDLRLAHSQDITADLPKDCVGCYALARLADVHTFDLAYPLDGPTEPVLALLEAAGRSDFADNYRAVRRAYERGEALPPGAKPLGVWANLGMHCNIRCIMCWQDHLSPLKLSNLQVDQIKALLPTAHTVQLVGGEPTAYKGFWDIAEEFQRVAIPHARFLMLTNGLLLTEDKLDRLHGIEHLTFSVNIDGPDKASYEKIRAGGDWDTLIVNLRGIHRYKLKHDREHWEVGIAFTLMRSNIELLEESLYMADEFDASWHCGVIFGEGWPVDQCDVFIRENIFRFGHIGFSKTDIIERLRRAIPIARGLRRSPEMAVTCLEATIDYVERTEQVMFPPDRVEAMLKETNRFKLSVDIGECLALYSKGDGGNIDDLMRRAQMLSADFGAADDSTIGAAVDLAATYERAQRPADVVAVLQPAILAAEQAGALRSLPLAEAKLCLARSLKATGGDLDQARGLAEAALAVLSEALGDNHSRVRAAAFNLGETLNRLERFDEGRAILEPTVAYYRTALVKHDAIRVRAEFELARALSRTGEPKQAEGLWASSLAFYKQTYGREHSYAAVAAQELAMARISLGSNRDVETLLDDAVAYYDKAFGTGNELSRDLDARLAHGRRTGDWTFDRPQLRMRQEEAVASAIAASAAARMTTDPADALPALRRAVEEAETWGFASPLCLALGHLELARLHVAMHERNAAVVAFRAAHGFAERIAPHDALLLHHIVLDWGECCSVLEAYVEAVPLLKRASAFFGAFDGPDDGSRMRAYFELAKALSTTSAYEEAEPVWRKVYDYYCQTYGKEHSYSAVAAHELAKARISIGMDDRVETLIGDAIWFYDLTFGQSCRLSTVARSELASWQFHGTKKLEARV